MAYCNDRLLLFRENTFEYTRFGKRINRARRLVKDYNRGVAIKIPSQSKPLVLSAAQLGGRRIVVIAPHPLVDIGISAFFQFTDDARKFGLFHRDGNTLCRGGFINIAKLDIFAYRPVMIADKLLPQ